MFLCFIYKTRTLIRYLVNRHVFRYIIKDNKLIQNNISLMIFWFFLSNIIHKILIKVYRKYHRYLNSVRYFPRSIFPRATFQVTISQVATFQMCNFPIGNFPKIRLLMQWGLSPAARLGYGASAAAKPASGAECCG